jgi:hypothetical protein
MNSWLSTGIVARVSSLANCIVHLSQTPGPQAQAKANRNLCLSPAVLGDRLHDARRQTVSEEHITTVTSADGSTKHTTVTSGGRNVGSWLLGLAALILLGFGIYYFAMQSGSQARKDNAVAGAAQDVGAAARDVGAAAKDAADSLNK